MDNPVPYFVRFGKSYRARYFKLEPLAEINGKVSTAIGEVGILALSLYQLVHSGNDNGFIRFQSFGY